MIKTSALSTMLAILQPTGPLWFSETVKTIKKRHAKKLDHFRLECWDGEPYDTSCP